MIKENINKYLGILVFIICSCSSEKTANNELKNTNSEVTRVDWSILDTLDYDHLNSDLKPGMLTMDLGIYYPSNLDSSFDKVTMQLLLNDLREAMNIYRVAKVQINLMWIKSGAIDPKFLSIQANKVPQVPQTEYANMYQHIHRHPFVPTKQTLDAFESFIEKDQDNHRTLYMIILQDVFLPYLDVYESRFWMMKSVRSGGLSFPPYTYVGTMPENFRGAFTISNLKRSDSIRKTIAHEIGHKLINVGHEYNEIKPQASVFAEDGLMVYGTGKEIPSGIEGRWHQERLHLSPFLYRLNESGEKVWNKEYIEGGHYYDPLYGNYVIHFRGDPPIDENW